MLMPILDSPKLTLFTFTRNVQSAVCARAFVVVNNTVTATQGENDKKRFDMFIHCN